MSAKGPPSYCLLRRHQLDQDAIFDPRFLASVTEEARESTDRLVIAESTRRLNEGAVGAVSTRLGQMA